MNIVIAALVVTTAMALEGCTRVTLNSGQFSASRTAVLVNLDGDFSLKTPDGSEVSATGLKSEVDSKTLGALISKIPVGPMP
jgi:hypothetical protein